MKTRWMEFTINQNHLQGKCILEKKPLCKEREREKERERSVHTTSAKPYRSLETAEKLSHNQTVISKCLLSAKPVKWHCYLDNRSHSNSTQQ